MARSPASHASRATKAPSVPGAGFGSRLQSAIRERGWTNGETARRVREQLGDGAKFSPGSISHYTRGRAVPRPRYLHALSAVLGIDKRKLMGQDNSSIRLNGGSKDIAIAGQEIEAESRLASATPALHLEDRGSEVWLQINQQVSWAIALEVLQLLKGEDSGLPTAAIETGPTAESSGQ